jgi:hypothetical protein
MKRTKRLITLAAVIADIVVWTNGCVQGVVDIDDGVHHGGNHEASAPFFRTEALVNEGRVRIVGGNGSIRVWGIPGAGEVVIDAVRRVRSDSRADAEAHLSEVQVLVRSVSGVLEVKTLQPDRTHGRSYIVDYEITVPAQVQAQVANGNGTVRLEGIQADLEVQNGNGDVSLVDVAGSSWVGVGNGTVSTWAFLPDGGQLVHAVGNGTIQLSVQPDVDASFDAKVGNGTISMTGLDLHDVVTSPRHLQGVLGLGSGLIDLAVGNGQIRVQGW